MKTYNTYQEAKIANPDSCICKWDGKFTASSIGPLGHALQPCNPADYCMTVERFLKSGYKFAEGDKYLFSDGYVDTVTVGGNESQIRNGDESRYILRAKALEQPKQDEWKSGDLCEYHYDEGGIWRDGVYVALDNGFHVIRDLQDDGYAGVTKKNLRKPETPEQKEERERLEVIDSMYMVCAKFSNGPVRDSDTWLECEMLYEAGYRKVEG